MHPQILAVIDDFTSLDEQHRLALLLEYSETLPLLPPKFGDHPELLERVTECQSPVFIAVEGNSTKVDLHFSAPPEAPTTRGFASVLSCALNGLSAADICALPDSFVDQFGLTRLVSPLRMRGMGGMLFRIKRKARELI